MNQSQEVVSMTCPICCRPAGSPFRVYDNRGKVTSGCVASFHNGQLVTPSESAWWHVRQQRALRRAGVQIGKRGL